MPASWLEKPAVSGELHSWLTSSGSLSERIAGCCSCFHVQRLLQARRRAFPDEAALVSLDVGARAFVREVLLYCGDTPVVFAHSVVAPKHLRGAWRAIRGLGSQPLASALFADRRVQRGELRFCKLSNRSLPYIRAAEFVFGLPDELWARRSVFRRNGAPLLVTEVFLPEILRLRCSADATDAQEH